MNKIKIIFAGPGNGVEGGIPAVISGLEKCYEILNERVDYRRLVYAKARRGMSKKQRLFSEISQFLTFVKQLIKFQPEIVHIQTSFDKKTLFRDSLHSFVTHLFGKKNIIHIHGGQWEEVVNWNFFWKWWSSKFLKRCDLVIVTSEEELKWLEKEYKGQVKVSLLNNVVELEFDINKIRIFSEDKRRVKKIIFASRLIETKGILDLLNAIRLLEGRDDFILDIYGSGSLEKETKKYIHKYNLSQKIIFKGEIDFNSLMVEYAKADIFVFPSYHHEGFPMAFFYAVACGMSIVSSRVRPIPHFLETPSNCLYVEQKNPDSIAEKIAVLLDDPSLMNKMTKNNIEFIKKFSSHEVSNELFLLYELI